MRIHNGILDPLEYMDVVQDILDPKTEELGYTLHYFEIRCSLSEASCYVLYTPCKLFICFLSRELLA